MIDKEKYTFAANNSSDPEEAKKVLAALKRIIRFGKHAEHALAQIQEHGFYDGRAAYIELNGSVYSLVEGSFPKVERVTRDLIEGFGDYKLGFRELQNNNSYYRKLPSEIPVDIIGPQKIVWNGEQIIRAPLKDQLGWIKLLKKDFSFRHRRDNYYDAKTYRIFTKHDSEGGKLAMQAMAENIAEKLIQHSRYDYDVPYQLKDLKKMIPRWLKEDGVLEKIFDEFKNYGRVQKIMEE